MKLIFKWLQRCFKGCEKVKGESEKDTNKQVKRKKNPFITDVLMQTEPCTFHHKYYNLQIIDCNENIENGLEQLRERLQFTLKKVRTCQTALDLSMAWAY